MAPQSTIDEHREGAEVYTGDELCKQKTVELLEELHLPRGLLPVDNVEEVGYNRKTGFVWLRQKKSISHNFRKVQRLVSYASEVSAFVEDRRMKRLSGIKSKELLIWITLSELLLDPNDHSKITFKTPSGLYRSFPAAAFELEDDKKPAPAPASSAAAEVPPVQTK
ncbi:uncharacterized protein LOC144703079 [Wolffia australiana]